MLSVFFLLGAFGLVTGFVVLGFDPVSPRALLVAAAFSFRILLAAVILVLFPLISAYRSSDLASSSACQRLSSLHEIAFDMAPPFNYPQS
jgi:ABC-type transport system involved in multi-copper enzyme maturation permease subunit